MNESSFYQEIIAEGEQLRGRKDILRLLELRFGAEAAKEFEQAVNRIQHLEQLEALLDLAIQSRRLSQFRRAFPGQQA